MYDLVTSVWSLYDIMVGNGRNGWTVMATVFMPSWLGVAGKEGGKEALSGYFAFGIWVHD